MAKRTTKSKPKARASRSKTKPKSKTKSKTTSKTDGVRSDGWSNLNTGRGTTADQRAATHFKGVAKKTMNELASLYEFSGLARKIVDAPVDDMTRNWFTIQGDDDDAITQRMEELMCQKKVNSAGKMARLFGGSIILMGIKDGKDLQDPVNENTIKEVTSLTVFDRREVEPRTDSLYDDLGEPHFGEPQLYDIFPVTGAESTVVHESRLMIFEGDELPRTEWQSNGYWHSPIFRTIYENLRQTGAVFDSAEFIVEDFVQTIIQIENIMQLMRTKKGEALIKKRMDLLDKTRSSMNVLFMGTNETYAKHTATVSGLELLLDRFMMMLSAVCGIPVTRLFGRSPAGQNATGESDMRNYYDEIRSEQRNTMTPTISRLIQYLFMAQGNEPEQWKIEYKPLQEPTPKEQAELYDMNAKGDAANVQNGIADPEELERFRFGGDQYNGASPTYDVPEEREDPLKSNEIPPAFLAGGGGNEDDEGNKGEEDPEKKPTDDDEEGSEE